jgi:hypothetical protein
MYRFFIVKFLVAVGPIIAATEPFAFSQPEARDVLERFCELDAQGDQLNPEGRQEIVALFVTPGAPRLDKIIVVRDFVVSHPAFETGRAEFYVEYVQLGQISVSLARFSRLPPLKVRAGFDLLPSDKPDEVGPDGKGTHVVGPTGWRIEGSPREPHLTVDAAIRYAAELRAKTPDVAIRKNAEKTIAALKRLH